MENLKLRDKKTKIASGTAAVVISTYQTPRLYGAIADHTNKAAMTTVIESPILFFQKISKFDSFIRRFF